MSIWIVAASIGGLLSLAGFAGLLRRYRRGEIRRRYLLASIVGYTAFATYALLSALLPTIVHGLVGLAVLLPAFVSIVVLVHEHQRASPAGRPSD